MCTYCRNILSNKLIDRSVTVEVASLAAFAESCLACNLLIRVLLDHVSDDGNIKLFRTKASLNTDPGGNRLVRIGAYLGKFAARLRGVMESTCRLNLGRHIQLDQESSTARPPHIA